MGKSSAPPAPDYTGAAQATAAGNLEAARATTAANRVNQITPNGNLTYSQDPNAANPDSGWTATQTLSPAQQAIQNQTNTLNQGLMTTANSGLNYANNVLSQPGVDTSKLAQTGINPGQSYQDAMMARLDPQITRENNANEQMLANQGIGVGSEAYGTSKNLLNQSHNDLLNNATTQGFNTGLAANQQGFQQQAYNQMQPINVINALRTGSQVQNPQFNNVPQQTNPGGADLLGAKNAQYGAQMQGYNSQVGQQNSMQSGLFGLGAATAPYWAPALMAMSDIRLKKNIKRIGTHPLGIGIYSFDYIWNEPSVGVMAQEVLNVKPSAVVMHPSGFMMVNYGSL